MKPILSPLALALFAVAALVARPATVRAADPDPAALVGTWTAQDGGVRVRAVLRADGTFVRTMEGADGPDVVEGRYTVKGRTLTIAPAGGEAMAFVMDLSPAGVLTLQGADGSVLTLARERTTPPDGAGPNAATANPLVPAWVRPGLRLTYYMMTGTLSGSVNGFVLDENGDWQHRVTKVRYAKERVGHSSHGLLQATVVGMDERVTALAKPFYLFNGEDRTPVFNRSLDQLVTSDSGGDFWMHPTKQAAVLREHPWTLAAPVGGLVARTVPWTVGGRAYRATMIATAGEGSRMTHVYDQETGRLLSLHSISRAPPDVADPNDTMRNGVSSATFLEFVNVRQLDLPWLGAGLPAWAARVREFSYRGRFTIEGPGIVPTPLATSDDVTVTRRGADWFAVRGSAMTQGTVAPVEYDAVTGRGALPPLGIPPDVLAGLTVGQVIDRDPDTGFSVRVAAVDAQSVTLEGDGPRQSYAYVYSREQGVLARRVSHERYPVAPQNVSIRDAQLAAWK